MNKSVEFPTQEDRDSLKPPSLVHNVSGRSIVVNVIDNGTVTIEIDRKLVFLATATESVSTHTIQTLKKNGAQNTLH